MTASNPNMVTSLDKVQANSGSPLLEDWQREERLKDKAYNQKTVKVLRSKGLNSHADRLKDCGHIYGYYACGSCAHTDKLIQNFCGMHRLCPICARINRHDLIHEICEAVRLIKKRPVVGHEWRFITLTVRTEGEYKKSVEKALKGFSKLYKNFLRGRRTACVRTVEFGPKNGNVHIHALYYGPYMAQEKLSDVWERYTGSKVVDIRLVEPKAVETQVEEICKYITKFTDVSNSRLVEIWQSVHRKRLVERYGLFRKDVLKTWVEVPEQKKEYKEPESDLCPRCGSDHWLFVYGYNLDLPPPGTNDGV